MNQLGTENMSHSPMLTRTEQALSPEPGRIRSLDKRHGAFRSVSLLVLLLSVFLPLRAGAQSGATQASFSTTCNNCWPGWTEMTRPARGVGPRVRNGAAFIFINGSLDDPRLNEQHLLFEPSMFDPAGVRQVNVTFSFNNATIGGRLLMTDGTFVCLPPALLLSFVSDELFVVTLRDKGDSWYGAFIGDVTLIVPEFIADPEMRQPYTTAGLLQRSPRGLEVLDLKVIPQISRFSPLRLNLWLEESDGPKLGASIRLATGKSIVLEAELDRESILSPGPAGIIYQTGNGSPCTSLVQREVSVREFASR